MSHVLLFGIFMLQNLNEVYWKTEVLGESNFYEKNIFYHIVTVFRSILRSCHSKNSKLHSKKIFITRSPFNLQPKNVENFFMKETRHRGGSRGRRPPLHWLRLFFQSLIRIIIHLCFSALAQYGPSPTVFLNQPSSYPYRKFGGYGRVWTSGGIFWLCVFSVAKCEFNFYMFLLEFSRTRVSNWARYVLWVM